MKQPEEKFGLDFGEEEKSGPGPTFDTHIEETAFLQETARFEGILQEIVPYYHWFGLTGMAWEHFYQNWKLIPSDGMEQMLQTRKHWLEMQKGGVLVEEILMKKIKSILASNDKFEIYKHLLIYEGFGYKNSVTFLGEVLNHPVIRSNRDRSCAHEILSFIARYGDAASAPAVLRYIDYVVSPDYQLGAFRDEELYYTVGVLRSLLGDALESTLHAFAETDPTFQGWFAKSKLKVFSNKALTGTPVKQPLAHIDFEEEERRIALLEDEYTDAKDNPPLEIDWSFNSEPPLPFEPDQPGGEQNFSDTPPPLFHIFRNLT